MLVELMRSVLRVQSLQAVNVWDLGESQTFRPTGAIGAPFLCETCRGFATVFHEYS